MKRYAVLNKIRTTVIYVHDLNREGKGVRIEPIAFAFYTYRNNLSKRFIRNYIYRSCVKK
jgi:hypothetical protein